MSIDAKEDVKMKCDELKYENLGDMMPFYPRSTLVIRKQFVDAAIAELKEVYKDSVDVKVKIWERYKKAEDELRKTQRALWLARAERAMAESYSVLNDVSTSNRWVKALNKLKAKADEFKEAK